MKNIFKILALTTLLLSSGIAMAGGALSWNLSRDMMTGITKNPKGVWSFMQTQTLHNSGLYALLPDYSKFCIWAAQLPNTSRSCWQDLSTGIFAGVETKGATRGMPVLHPQVDRAVLVRWKSPISGTVDIMGRVSHADGSGLGDGVDWFVDYQSETLLSGSVNSTGNTFFKQSISVVKGRSLYFIIDRGVNNDASADTTYMDIIITSQQ